MYNSFDFFSSFFYLSQLLYSFYTFSFLIAGLILLVAMIGAILLTMDFSSTNSSQVISKQNSRAGLVTFFCGVKTPPESKARAKREGSKSYLKDSSRACVRISYRLALKNLKRVTYMKANFKVVCTKMRSYNKRQLAPNLYLSFLLLLTIILILIAGVLNEKGYLDRVSMNQIIVYSKAISALLLLCQTLLYARFLHKDILAYPDFMQVRRAN